LSRFFSKLTSPSTPFACTSMPPLPSACIQSVLVTFHLLCPHHSTFVLGTHMHRSQRRCESARSQRRRRPHASSDLRSGDTFLLLQQARVHEDLGDIEQASSMTCKRRYIL
jgi:hypothetical protein